ncbi:MAG: chemoreceptor glutamine deamidase CheD, partial [Usitatibacteraceae bacterium]
MLTGVDSECFATNFYHDRAHGIDAAKILPGEYFVTDEDMVIVTVLGSCVSACIRDPELGIGGMNHFMLPDSEREKEVTGPLSTAARYG